MYIFFGPPPRLLPHQGGGGDGGALWARDHLKAGGVLTASRYHGWSGTQPVHTAIAFSLGGRQEPTRCDLEHSRWSPGPKETQSHCAHPSCPAPPLSPFFDTDVACTLGVYPSHGAPSVLIYPSLRPVHIFPVVCSPSAWRVEDRDAHLPGLAFDASVAVRFDFRDFITPAGCRGSDMGTPGL